MKVLKSYAFLLAVGGLVVAADQVVKHWVENAIPFGHTIAPLPMLPWLQITNWHNSGMAFGLGQDWGWAFLLLGAVYALGVLLAFPSITRHGWWLRWGMAVQWGGAIGNLLDRWQHGYVTDFIAVGRFPVFNLADAAISLSVLILLAGEWFAEPKEQTPPYPNDALAPPTAEHPSRDV